MKKTLSLMILAGLLTASLASCVVEGNDPEVPTGSEPYYQVTTSQTPQVTLPQQNSNPKEVTYIPANEIVYIIDKNVSLKPDDEAGASITLGVTTKLTRIGTSSYWSKVEYQGAVYYIAKTALTTDDLGEETFTACTKTKYVSGGTVYVRPYASSSADLYKAMNIASDLGSRTTGDEIKVIAESKDWSKIEWTESGTTKKGFIHNSMLSDRKPSVSDTEFLNQFTANEPVTMYVSVGQTVLREKPYADDRGSEMDVLKKGTAVTVIATGTVENVLWSMVEWEVNSVKVKYYVASSSLAATTPSNATLEQMLKAYPTLVAFETEIDLYVSADSMNGRSTPTLLKEADNIVKSLFKGNKVHAVASGRIEGQDANGASTTITWCLIQDPDPEIGFYFVSYSYLTPNADGTPAPIPVSLEELIKTHGFTKLSTPITMTVKAKSKVMSAPNVSSVVGELEQGTNVSVVARGAISDGFVTNDWYIIKHENTYYFIIQGQLELPA